MQGSCGREQRDGEQVARSRGPRRRFQVVFILFETFLNLKKVRKIRLYRRHC